MKMRTCCIWGSSASGSTSEVLKLIGIGKQSGREDGMFRGHGGGLAGHVRLLKENCSCMAGEGVSRNVGDFILEAIGSQ